MTSWNCPASGDSLFPGGVGNTFGEAAVRAAGEELVPVSVALLGA